MIRPAAFVLLAAIALSAQEQGVSTEWDVRNQMAALAKSVREVEAVVRRADPKVWEENAAPEAYVGQLRSAQNTMQALTRAADDLARNPEKLQSALETYFQMEQMGVLIGSLGEGIRKYQSPELADMFSQTSSRNTVHRDRLRQHIRDLADLREQEYQIANEEAQRCRANLTKQSSAQSESRTEPSRSQPRQQTRPQQPSSRK